MPECGSEFPIKVEDSTLEQGIQSKFGISNQTKIVSAERKRKNYDSFGNLIPDDDVIAIKESAGAGGKKIVYYENKVVGEEDKVYVSK